MAEFMRSLCVDSNHRLASTMASTMAFSSGSVFAAATFTVTAQLRTRETVHPLMKSTKVQTLGRTANARYR